ncbi:septal ring lytic transglycosylase RlpA family protein [Rhodovibrionaceae bacterium A322]
MRGKLTVWQGALILVLLTLAGCSEVELASHTVKQMQGQETIGRYKVGTPYQIKGIWYYPKVDYSYDETGIASWYGPNFHGKQTANGEIYDQNALTAAHRTLPMPSLVKVTNLENGRSLELRISDRGPYHGGRIIDVSKRGAELLGFKNKGTAKVRVQVLEGPSRQLAMMAKGGTQMAALRNVNTAPPAPAPPAVPVEGVSVETLSDSPGSQPEPANSGSATTTQDVTASYAAASPLPDGKVTVESVESSNIYVQAGAFTQVHNAKRLAAQLSSLGNVRVNEKEVNGTYFFRVHVGPVASVEQADELMQLLLDNGYDKTSVVVN